MVYHDRAAGKILDRGKLAISVQILPMSEVEMRPAGFGRSEPNDNPVLQAPFGRYTFGNPMSMLLGILRSLCGPTVLCVLCCLCVTVCTMSLFLFVATYLSGINAIVQLARGGG